MKSKWLVLSVLSLLLIFVLMLADYAISDSKDAKPRGYLGVIVEPLTKEMKSELGVDFGVMIAEVVLDSPADEAGLMEDDVILKVNGIKIRRPHTLTRVIRKINPGDKATIQVLRDGKKESFEVKIGKLESKTDFKFPFPGKKLSVEIHSKPRLGVRLAELNEDLASYFDITKGALVIDVEEESPAARAGIKPGDVIIKIGDDTVENPDDVREIIEEAEPDEEISVEVIRHGKSQKFVAKLDECQSEDNIFMLPKSREHGMFMFSPEKMQRMNEEAIERMFRWYSPDRGIRIEKRILKTPDKII